MRASVLTLVVLAVGLVMAPVANAAAFRYWTYWQGQGASWVFATQGPATAVPPDGSVEGWRFAVTTQAASGQDSPGIAADFATICAKTPAVAGKKRVALAIDPGPAAIAPAGQQPPSRVATCVVADPDATGFAILQTIAPVRTEGGLICSLGGYPQGECAPILDDAEAQRVAQAEAAAPASSTADPGTAGATSTPPPIGQPAQSDSGSPWATIAVAVLLLAGAAFWTIVYRRRAGAAESGASHHG